MRPLRNIFLSALAILVMAGCAKKETAIEPPPAEAPLPLASVNGVAITEEDFSFEVQRRAAAGRPVGEPSEVLQDLVERQAMLQKAEASDVMKDPAVRRELDNKRLGQWLDRSLQVERDAVRVSDDELLAYYEKEQDSFTRPAMVRLAVLYRRASGDSSTTLQEELETAKAEFLADPAVATQNGRIPGFGTVAVKYSEDTISRHRGGDLGWLDGDAATKRLPASVMQAGSGLERGAISDVISADEGLYIVMKCDHRPPQVSPYDDVAPGLRRRLIRLKQEDVERSFMSNVLADVQIDINQEKAALLTVPAPAVPVPPVLRPVEDLAPARTARTP
jgi:parvulin-like peptidyl-prolyl isomerase